MFFVTIDRRWKTKLSTAVGNFSIQSRTFFELSARAAAARSGIDRQVHPAGVDLEAAELN
jgi:hypothetical protein